MSTSSGSFLLQVCNHLLTYSYSPLKAGASTLSFNRQQKCSQKTFFFPVLWRYLRAYGHSLAQFQNLLCSLNPPLQNKSSVLLKLQMGPYRREEAEQSRQVNKLEKYGLILVSLHTHCRVSLSNMIWGTVELPNGYPGYVFKNKIRENKRKSLNAFSFHDINKVGKGKMETISLQNLYKK